MLPVNTQPESRNRDWTAITLLLMPEASSLRRWWVEALTSTFPLSLQKQVYIAEMWELGRGKVLRELRLALPLGTKGRGSLKGSCVASSQAHYCCSGVISPFALAFLSSPDACCLWPGRLCVLWLGRRGMNCLLSSVLG